LQLLRPLWLLRQRPLQRIPPSLLWRRPLRLLLRLWPPWLLPLRRLRLRLLRLRLFL
jgi:hypothetical protein